MNKTDYNEILDGVLKRASENKDLDLFKETLKGKKIKELREDMKHFRFLYVLDPSAEIHNNKQKAIDTEITLRFLGLNK